MFLDIDKGNKNTHLKVVQNISGVKVQLHGKNIRFLLC